MRSRLYSFISIPVFAFLYSFTAFGVLVVIIPCFFRMKGFVRFCFKYWARSVFLIMGKRFKVHGRENINPQEKYILIANHSSLFDIVAIVSFYPGISWFGHERLLRIPVFGRLLRLTDYVPFTKPTLNNTRKMLDQLAEISKTRSIAIFPEGTRTLNGNINDFYKGFIWLLRSSDICILPVTLNGFYQLKPKNRSYINFGAKLDVIVHKPIKKSELVCKTDIEIIESVRSVIESVHI